ncbi:MAG TPA: hypothetical protein VL624_08965 [Caldimonas sp.]|jgi:hypothetical protein|nr:hypothetical protein [Caldimonas sp.]
MKLLQVPTMLVFLLAAAPLGAAAQPAAAAGPGGDFAQHKQRELARIAERIQALQALQGCVQAAADSAALQLCNENARASMKGRGR